MRNVLCQSLCQLYEEQRFVFLTGDLGFNALEPLRDKMKTDFINAGIAEQNMISVAAGLALGGMSPWVYSIAPFCYARPFEQIRNDVCLHDLPVRIVGNGGGYGYGVMGATHHAIEDYGTLLTLTNMHVFVPAFGSDVNPVIRILSDFEHPAYLRLGRSEVPEGFVPGPYAPWRKVLDGTGLVIIIIGTLAGPIIGRFLGLPEERRPEVWVLAELPLNENTIPSSLIESIKRYGKVLVAEEHVIHGSAGQSISHYLHTSGSGVNEFRHLCARGYPSGLYGSQGYHRRESGIDAESVAMAAGEML